MQRKIFLLSILFLALVSGLSAQKSRLAQVYFQNGEYEKSASLYEELYNKGKGNPLYFNRFMESLMALERFEEAENLVTKEIRKNSSNVELYVTRGRIYEQQGKLEDADQSYLEGISKLSADRFKIIRLGNAFAAQGKNKLAIATYEKGAALLEDEQVFAYNLGDLYRKMGESEKMIAQYLNGLRAEPKRINNLKTIFQRYLSEVEYDLLQAELYARLQEDQEAIYYNELLSWVFIQRKNYKGAFRQVRALDRRLEENGARVYKLGLIAANAGAYDAAIDAFDYIVTEKGAASAFYLDAKQQSLGVRREKLVAGFDYEEDELRALEAQYISFLDEFGRGAGSADIIMELALLEAFYLNDLAKATDLLVKLVETPGLKSRKLALAKLQLADLYLMQGERWESTLLYSQVDKTYKEDVLGHDARFRNARLSYYMGDFEWAQSQFDALKSSTSKLIANDALDLSVFIMDNLGLDTTAAALELYATADLLNFQNRFEEAYEKIEELIELYPEHTLQDDILYLRANIHRKRREYQQAANYYQQVFEKHTEEIRADNALFALAELYELHLKDEPKAMALYERLFLDFSGSTYAVEARKRFRRLRGDEI